MEIEEWRTTSILSDCYEVSNFGRIKSIKTIDRPRMSGRILSPIINPDGYERITLRNLYGYTKSYFIHVLIADAFIPRIKNKNEVNHKNGICNDNRIENLEWTTRKENAQHASAMGLLAKNECNGNSKLDKVEIREIREAYINGEKVADLAEDFGVSKVWIYKIINEEAWIGV